MAICEWKEQIDVDKWAETEFTLEESSAVGGGKYSFEYAPALRLPMRVFGFDNISDITYWIGSQGGKSTLSYALINYTIDRLSGANIAFYLPNDGLVSYTATNRILPSIKRVPQNAKLVKETKETSKLKDNSKIIRIGGAVLRIMGAESSTNRKSFPAQVIFMDEIAEFKKAHVLEIEERNKTFASYGGKIVKLSTSVHKKDAVVDSHNRAEVQVEFHVKCPKCGKSHIDDFINQVRFPKAPAIPEHITKQEDIEVYINSYLARNATYECPHCNTHWDNDIKNQAIDMGESVVVRGDINKDHSVSFRASSFVSKFVSIYDLAKKWLAVKDGEEELIIKFYNGWLSKVYKPKIKTIPSEKLWLLKSKIPYESVCDNTIGLVGAVDVQKDHFYMTVLAVDDRMNVIISEYQRIETAHELEMNILRPRYKTNGELINVEAWAIDSGYNTNEIYNFCYDMNTLHNHMYDDETIAAIFDRRGGEPVNCIPIKGSSRSTSQSMSGKSQITTIDKDIDGKVFDDTLKLHVINTYYYADLSMRQITSSIEKVESQIEKFPESQIEIFLENEIKNSLQFHADMDGDIVRSLTSEYKKELSDGKFQYVPAQTHPFNHYWDCLKYGNYLIEKLEMRHRELIAKVKTDAKQDDSRSERRKQRYRDSWRDEY